LQFVRAPVLVIPRSTISICPTMTPIEEPQNLQNYNTKTRTGPPLPLTTPGWRTK
jgi:hypothetical protein